MQIVRCLYLFALCLFIAFGSQAQEGNTATATATATIVTDMAGIQKLSDINLKENQITSTLNNNTSSLTSVSFPLKVIGDSKYSISIATDNIAVSKNGSEETIALTSLHIESSSDITSNSNLNIYATLDKSSKPSFGAYTSATPVTLIINYN